MKALLLVILLSLMCVSFSTNYFFNWYVPMPGFVNTSSFITNETDPIWGIASPNVARIGNCPVNYSVQNTTTSGVKCIALMSGPQGPKGDKGDKGNDGSNGAPGPPGADGINGTNGVNGTNAFTNVTRGYGLNDNGTVIAENSTIAINSSVIAAYQFGANNFNGTGNFTTTGYFFGNLNASYIQNPPWQLGTVTSIATTAPITGGTITSTGTIGITKANATTDGYLAQADWGVFDGKAAIGSSAVCVYGIANATTTTSGINATCAAQQGTVTSIAASAPGLAGGTITSTGTIALNTTYTDARYFNMSNANAGTLADARIASASTWSGKAISGSYGTCAYGISVIAGGTGAWTGTCAVQQGSVTSIAASAPGLTGGTITTSGTVALNKTYTDLLYLNMSNAVSGTLADARIASASTWSGKAGVGGCGTGQFVQNTTTSGVQCLASPSAQFVSVTNFLSTPVNIGIILNTTTAKPICAAGIRGGMWFNQSSAGGVADSVFICGKQAGGTYAWGQIQVLGW